MNESRNLCFKVADSPDEFEAIHRLNYRTFVEEIPQHRRNGEERLVDKFHDENTYFICLDDGKLAGMICGRAKRPFSLDYKLPDLDRHLPAKSNPMEVRLLAVERGYRNGYVFSRLAGMLARHYYICGHDVALISGTLRQKRLYDKLGFVAFGPVVGTGEALYQPMYLTLEGYASQVGKLSIPQAATSTPRVCFLPGPVETLPEVRSAFRAAPFSHRSEAFMESVGSIKRSLCAMHGAGGVELMLGSGTLANDAVAAQLGVRQGRCLILANGEFGERLVDHAKRHGLDFEAVCQPWGEPLDYSHARDILRGQAGNFGTLWAVHCETSTGVLNDLEQLRQIADEHSLELALDCISSIGTLPVNLKGVAFATCTSGKGLASYPGISMVFYNGDLRTSDRIPRYLDIGHYARCDGVPFTQSSNLVMALKTALETTDWDAKHLRVRAASSQLRSRLQQGRFDILAPEGLASPAVLTLQIPSAIPSLLLGKRLRRAGFDLSFESGYLAERNWVQICLMGEWIPNFIEILPDAFSSAMSSFHGR